MALSSCGPLAVLGPKTEITDRGLDKGFPTMKGAGPTTLKLIGEPKVSGVRFISGSGSLFFIFGIKYHIDVSLMVNLKVYTYPKYITLGNCGASDFIDQDY